MEAYVYRNGVIGFGQRTPAAALVLFRGKAKPLRDAVGVLARHGYERGVLLVPGVPEAEDGAAAFAAVQRFTTMLIWKMSGQSPYHDVEHLLSKPQALEQLL